MFACGIARVEIALVAAGGDHTVVVTADGRAFSWGANSRGQLGLGHRNHTTTPQHIESVKRKVVAVACGSMHSILLTVAGSVYTCGAGQCVGFPVVVGDNTLTNVTSTDAGVAKDIDVPTGVKVLSAHSIRHVSCGWGHSLAVSHAGDLYAWGYNDSGQLGLGVKQKIRYVPALVRRLPDDWEDQQQELQELVEATARRIGTYDCHAGTVAPVPVICMHVDAYLCACVCDIVVHVCLCRRSSER